MQIHKLLKPSLIVIGMINCPIAWAGFSTYSSTWPDDASVVNEKVVVDTKPASIKPTEICEEKTSKRLSEQNRLYAKIAAAFVTDELRTIQNVSTSSALSNSVLTLNSVKDNYVTWEVGLGTKYKYLRYEVEYIYQKNVQYNPNPLFNGQSEVLTSYYSNQGAWLNLVYDMDKATIPYFTPYLGGLIGFMWNKTHSAMQGGVGNGTQETHSRYAVGWGVNLGIRIPFWERWFGYIEYKYLDQGMVRWKDSTGLMELKAKSVVQGVNVGVQYLLG